MNEGLTFGRTDASRCTSQRKRWAPLSPWRQGTGAPQCSRMWPCCLPLASFQQWHCHFKDLPHSSRFAVCPLHTCGFETLPSKGRTRHGWVVNNMSEACCQQAQNRGTWIRSVGDTVPSSASLETNLRAAASSTLHGCSWWDTRTMCCVLFAFISTESSKLLVFTFFVLFLGQIHTVKRFARNTGKWIMETDFNWEAAWPGRTSCRCRSDALA